MSTERWRGCAVVVLDARELASRAAAVAVADEVAELRARVAGLEADLASVRAERDSFHGRADGLESHCKDLQTQIEAAGRIIGHCGMVMPPADSAVN